MVEQPSGTVTVLFTDIEGSTRLLQKLGRERYAGALEPQRLYQLLGDGLRDDFPPPRTLENHPTNPARAADPVGRPRRRAGRGIGSNQTRRGAAADADGCGRDGEDAACAPARGGAGG